MNSKALISVSLMFFALILVALCGYFAWNRYQNRIANDPYTHFSEAGAAIVQNNPTRLMSIIASHPHVVYDKFTFDQGTLLHSTMTNQPNQACAAVLIQAGADVNATDYVGRTPLHYVCRYGADLSAIQYLVSEGADVNAKSGLGETPLSLISGEFNDPARQYLKSQGAVE